VERLSGSELAKQRLTIILQTLRGELTVPEACARLGICEARFHALRSAWLQDALELLEPRQLGRPPHPADVSELQSRLQALETQNEQLRHQLAASEVRRELAEALPHVVRDSAAAVKKGAPTQPPQNRRPAR
jgi:transposase-like protein